MKKRMLSLVLTACMLLGMLPVTTGAAELNWADDIATVTTTWDDGGNIATAVELAQFAYNVNNKKDYSGKIIKLTADIDLTGKQWTPIGTSANPFSGTFDGMGHTISKLTIAGTGDYQGLFAYIGAGTVRNLGLVGCNVTGGRSVGGIAGFSNGNVKNCYVTGTVTGTYYVGGLVGENEGTLKNCYSTAAVTSSSGESTYIGALAGDTTVAVAGYYLAESASVAVGGYKPALEKTRSFTGDTLNSAIEVYSLDDEAKPATTSLLQALNDGADSFIYYTWLTGTASENGGYPVFGPKYVTPHTHGVNGTGSSGLTYTAWTSTTSLPMDSGSYYLSNNVTLATDWGLGLKTINLCLNGHTINTGAYTLSLSGTQSDNSATVLNLCDCKTDGTIIGSTKTGGNGTVVQIEYGKTSPTFNMYGGKITGSDTGVTLETYGFGNMEKPVFNMYGGTITGNTTGIKYGSGTVNLDGAVALTGNTGADVEYTPYLSPMTLGTKFSTTTSIGVNVGNENDGQPLTGALTSAFASDVSSKFTYVGEHPLLVISNGAGNAVQLKFRESWTDAGNYDETLYATEEGDWQIADAADLAAFAKKLNDDSATFAGFTLTGDIVLTGKLWNPLKNFEGTFDGGGYTISGMDAMEYTSWPAYAGLFGELGDSSASVGVKNLTVSGTVKALSTGNKAYAGGIAGAIYGSSADHPAFLQNCVSNVIVTATGARDTYAGGIAGDHSFSRMINCVNNGAVTANAGSAENTGSRYAYAGGLAGYSTMYADSACINNSYNTGAVAATAIEKNNDSGAFVGGIAGYLRSDNLRNCYNVGTVTGTSGKTAAVGGVVGENSGGTITSCYYLATAETDNEDGTTFKTAEEMKAADFVAALNGWVTANTTDFGDAMHWKQEAGQNTGYPVLTTVTPAAEPEVKYWLYTDANGALGVEQSGNLRDALTALWEGNSNRGGKIQLQKDVTATQNYDVAYSRKVELDLNGKTLNLEKHALVVQSTNGLGAVWLTVSDSKTGGKIVSTGTNSINDSGYHGAIWLKTNMAQDGDSANLIVLGGTIIGSGERAIQPESSNPSTIVLKGGTISAPNGCAITHQDGSSDKTNLYLSGTPTLSSKAGLAHIRTPNSKENPLHIFLTDLDGAPFTGNGTVGGKIDIQQGRALSDETKGEGFDGYVLVSSLTAEQARLVTLVNSEGKAAVYQGGKLVVGSAAFKPINGGVTFEDGNIYANGNELTAVRVGVDYLNTCTNIYYTADPKLTPIDLSAVDKPNATGSAETGYDLSWTDGDHGPHLGPTLFGGSKSANVDDVVLHLTGGEIFRVYGSGGDGTTKSLSSASVGNITIDVGQGMSFNYGVFASGYNGTVTGNVNVTVNGGTVANLVGYSSFGTFDGTASATVKGGTLLMVDFPTLTLRDDARVSSHSDFTGVYIKGGTRADSGTEKFVIDSALRQGVGVNLPAGYTGGIIATGAVAGDLEKIKLCGAGATGATMKLESGNVIVTVTAPPEFVPVTDITDVPTTATAGTDLDLTGTVAPATATNKSIVWSVKEPGTTGAIIEDSTLKTTAGGTAVVTATIANGLTESTDFTQDFTISVSPKPAPHVHDGVTFESQPNRLLNLYLQKNMDGMLTVPERATLNLCLNGYALDANSDGSVFEVDGTLNLYDCNGSNSSHTITVNGTTHTITGGLITGGTGKQTNDNTTSGGGVYINDSGKMTLYSGTIAGNKTIGGAGGGVYVAGNFTMEGGTISYNETTGGSNGGGLCVGGLTNEGNPVGTAILNGGTISHNMASGNGGGVRVTGGAPDGKLPILTLSGTVIADNTAGTEDGIHSNGKVILDADCGSQSITNLGTPIALKAPLTGVSMISLSPDTLNPERIVVTGATAGDLARMKLVGTDAALYQLKLEGTDIWLRTIPTYDVGGSITDSNDQKVTGAEVTIKLGNTEKGNAITDANGAFTIAGVSNGVYQLIITSGDLTVTKTITVSGGNLAVGTVKLPAGKQNSVVDVKPGTPDIVVGGLDEQFTATATENDKGITQADKDVIAASGEVELKLTVQSKTDTAQNAADIIQAAVGKTLVFLDLSVNKTVTPSGGSPTTTPLSELQKLLDARIPLSADQQEKTNYTIYRYHGTKVDTITTTPNADGEKLELIDGGKTLLLQTKKFSTYAIGFDKEIATPPPTDSTGYIPPTYKPAVPPMDGGSITVTPKAPKPGDTVTITPKPDDGNEVDKIVVTDKDGNEIPVTKTENGGYTFTQPKGSVTITVTFQPQRAKWNPFTDVTSADWFHDSVKHVYENGLMTGTQSDKFSPTLTADRAMIATVLYRMAGEPNAKTAASFSDVPADAYYAKAIAWAAESGIVKGYGNGSFGPNDPVTREQLAAILHRYAQFKGMDTVAKGDLSKFTDQPSTWAAESVRWAVGAGLISGRGNGVLAPTGQATRAETAKILADFAALLQS